MCFLSKTFPSSHCESKARVILTHSFLAESEDTPGLLCISGKSIETSTYAFDPQVLRWIRKKETIMKRVSSSLRVKRWQWSELNLTELANGKQIRRCRRKKRIVGSTGWKDRKPVFEEFGMANFQGLPMIQERGKSTMLSAGQGVVCVCVLPLLQGLPLGRYSALQAAHPQNQRRCRRVQLKPVVSAGVAGGRLGWRCADRTVDVISYLRSSARQEAVWGFHEPWLIQTLPLQHVLLLTSCTKLPTFLMLLHLILSYPVNWILLST